MFITLEMVQDYIIQKGWVVDNSYSDQRGLCVLYSNSILDARVLLPAHNRVQDMQRMIRDGIRIISQLEERSSIDVENDMLGDRLRNCPFCGSEALPGVFCVNKACIAHNLPAKEHAAYKLWNKRHSEPIAIEEPQ